MIKNNLFFLLTDIKLLKTINYQFQIKFNKRQLSIKDYDYLAHKIIQLSNRKKAKYLL